MDVIRTDLESLTKKEMLREYKKLTILYRRCGICRIDHERTAWTTYRIHRKTRTLLHRELSENGVITSSVSSSSDVICLHTKYNCAIRTGFLCGKAGVPIERICGSNNSLHMIPSFTSASEVERAVHILAISASIATIEELAENCFMQEIIPIQL